MNEQEKVIVNEEAYKKPKSKIGIIAIVFVIILVGIAGFLYYRSVMLKNPLKLLIHDTLSYMEKNVEEPKSGMANFSLKISGNSSNNTNNEIYSIISKLGINGHYGIDYTNKLVDFGINTTYENEKLINANIYFENGNGYIDLDELFDKYISVPIDNFNDMFNNNNYEDNYKTIYRSVDKVLDESLKDEYFKKEKVSLDGKNVVKTTLNLDKNNYDAIKKDVLNRLLEDNKFLESIASISGKTKEDVIDTLKEARDKDDKFEGLDISIYMNGSKCVQIEIADTTDKMTINDKDNKKYFSLYENDTLLYEIVIEGESENNKGNYIISFADKKEEYNITINMSVSFEEGMTIEKKDISNSISIDNIGEKESEEMSINILKNKGMIALLQEISKL